MNDIYVTIFANFYELNIPCKMARSRMIAQKRRKKFASLCINDLPKIFSAKSAITTNNFFVK